MTLIYRRGLRSELIGLTPVAFALISVLAKGSKMFGPKSGLRKFVATLSIVSVSLLLAPSAATAADAFPSTTEFLSSKFVAGKAIDGFSPGKADYGFTLEAMLQLRAAGKTVAQQRVAINHVLNDLTVSVNRGGGYLFDASKKFKPGLAGKFLFTGVALRVANGPTKNNVASLLRKAISADGTIVGSEGNTYDYAWVILGLKALNTAKDTALANRVALKLSSMALADGGFGFDRNAATSTSSADSTGIALQALVASKADGSATERAAKLKAIRLSSSYLTKTDVDDNHWQAFGDIDVNGTAYAAMGLKAAGVNKAQVAKYSTWLKSRLATDGKGFVTPWSSGAGDTFATAQSYVPLVGLSYLDLMKK